MQPDTRQLVERQISETGYRGTGRRETHTTNQVNELELMAMMDKGSMAHSRYVQRIQDGERGKRGRGQGADVVAV